MSEGPVPGLWAEPSPAGQGRGRGPLSRPTEIVDGTRWLFWLLVLISLALSALATLAQGLGPMTTVAVAATAVLTGSITTRYLYPNATWALDLLEASAILALVCSSPRPATVFAVIFALVWFRSLSGSTLGAVLRGHLYAGMMILSLPLVSWLPGATTVADAPLILTCLPPLLVNVFLARHLYGILRNVQQGAQRDAILAAAGSRLLGRTAPEVIESVTWEATSAICAATPDLRVLNVRPVGDGLDVISHAGDFVDAPTVLSARTRSELETRGRGAAVIQGLDDLDAAVGSVCVWKCVSITGPASDCWLIVGAHRRLPTQAVDTVTSVMALSVLALRNSWAHQELTALATSDTLTGLANRSLFNTALGEALAHAKQTETSVLFIDLDDFKHVNDRFGHRAGDELLRQVATRIAAATRSDDLCARLGGDEFAVLLPRTGVHEATEIGRRIVEAVAVPVELPLAVARVGASVGVAVAAGESEPEQLVQRADIAMYAAKARGKDRTQVYDDGLLHDNVGRTALEGKPQAATPIASLS